MEEYSIYALCDNKGDVFYIGMSGQVDIRFGVHKLNFGDDITLKVLETVNGTQQDAFNAEKKWIKEYISNGASLVNKQNTVSQETGSARLDSHIIWQIKLFVAENGGNIRSVLETGALWVMSDGAKEYIKKIKK